MYDADPELLDIELLDKVRPAATPTAAPAAETPAPARPRFSLRTRLFAGLGAVVLLAGLGFGGGKLIDGSTHVSTDNAYVDATSAQVTALVGGPVQSVPVYDTEPVKAGQVLVVLDDTDARIAVASAEAGLAQAERKVIGYLATDQDLGARIAARAADQSKAAAGLASARADLARAKEELDRRKALAVTGAVSGEELTQAQNVFATAAANVQAALAAQAAAAADSKGAAAALAANAALTQGTTVETNPEVAAARARLDQARVDLQRTVIRAPMDGVVAKNVVQVGQRVALGAPLMSVVPVQQAYVNANFKEVQLKKVHPGQPVILKSDLYGSKVTFHGRVVGLSGGTGSAFALIPAQNATGNWIKIVQRLPVRIALDPRELAQHPLRIGLTMDATIDTAR